MRAITHQDGFQYYNSWKDRLIDKPGRPSSSPNTANQDIGNIRVLFEGLFQAHRQRRPAEPIPQSVFQNEEGQRRSAAVRIIYALIETGCRPSEIAHLLGEDILLDENAPYIRIRSKKKREIKTAASMPEIPLVGASIEAIYTL